MHKNESHSGWFRHGTSATPHQPENQIKPVASLFTPLAVAELATLTSHDQPRRIDEKAAANSPPLRSNARCYVANVSLSI